jgi:pSer/pThr/pTyr-binding forkhead associated (FHA) protein
MKSAPYNLLNKGQTMIKLTVLDGPDTGNVFTPNRIPIVIGRSSDCDVVLHDGTVSRRHCVIESRGELFVVSDLRSPNGLFLNDAKNRIENHVLRNGDEIIFGKSRVRVELPAPVQTKPPAVSAKSVVDPTVAFHNPPLTIEDGLIAEPLPATLPSNWQEGMTVCVPRAKLAAGLEPLVASPVENPALINVNPEQRAQVSGFLNRVVVGIKKLFAFFGLSS